MTNRLDTVARFEHELNHGLGFTLCPLCLVLRRRREQRWEEWVAMRSCVLGSMFGTKGAYDD